MAFFEDDTPYEYDSSRGAPGMVNAGWLERSRPYRTGVIEKELLNKLAALCTERNFSEEQRRAAARRSHLGIHYCSLCPASLQGEPWFLRVGDPTPTNRGVYRRLRAWLSETAETSQKGRHPLGSKVLAIPVDQGEYRTPNLILHYILDHLYLPPKPMLDTIRGLRETLDGEKWYLVHGAAPGGLRRELSGYPELDDVVAGSVHPLLRRGHESEAIKAYREIRQVDQVAAETAVQEIASELRDIRRQRIAELIHSHGGLSESACTWRGCAQLALKDMAICGDHALPEDP